MSRPLEADALRAKALEVLAQMHQFNVTHPTATFTEIEEAVETALAGLRQDLLTQSVQRQPLADFRGADDPPACPACGAALAACGQYQRTVHCPGAVVVTVERTRGRCSVCGTELFPPG